MAIAKVVTLYNATPGGTGAGTTYNIQTDGPRNVEAPFQVTIAATATVAIEGSLDNTTFVSLASFTATGAAMVALFPYMRANITSFGSGAVKAMLLGVDLVDGPGSAGTHLVA